MEGQSNQQDIWNLEIQMKIVLQKCSLSVGAEAVFFYEGLTYTFDWRYAIFAEEGCLWC